MATTADTSDAPAAASAAHADAQLALLQGRLDEARERFNVPGVAVGIHLAGREAYAYSGVTSVENPLPIDEHTLFQIGSTTKTYTATAIMRLREQGRLALDDPVKKHVPELRLKDAEAERDATILHLLNHTAGWYGDVYDSTGDGDDALAKLVENMHEFGQTFPLGTRFSYNNVSVSLAGRVIEKVTGQTYEAAMKEVVLDPLGLRESFFFLNDIATRRFVVGHTNRDDSVEVHRPWAMARNGSPAGGISSTVHDQIRYARFHLGDGRAWDGMPVLQRATLELMKTPTVRVPQPGPLEQVGISWFISERVGGTTVSHGGNTGGQNHGFVMVPARDFAISVMTNSSPRGSRLEREIVRWALQELAGISEPASGQPLELTAEQLAEYAGVYSTEAAILTCAVEGDHLVAQSTIRPHVLAALNEEGQAPPPTPPIPFKITAGDGAIVIDGEAKGMQFQFARENGRITGLELGRFAAKENP